DLSSRLPEVQVDEVEAFYARWPGSYVEDRLRNDWLLELGRRRDWPALVRDYPRFRMNDDREVSCWWLFTEHLAGKDVADAARPLWFAQREVDDGCNLLATALVDAKRFGAAKAALGLLGNGIAREAADALDNPARFLRRSASPTRPAHELRVLAVMRLAQTDADAATAFMDDQGVNLGPNQAAWAWAYIGRQAAFKLSSDAAAHYQRALGLLRGAESRANPGWSDDTLAWGVRATLRSAAPAQRWPQVLRLIDWMGPNEARDPAWAYWRARALLAMAPAGAEGDAQRAEARRQQDTLANGLNFYATLAAEDLGRAPVLPPTPTALTAAERDAAANHPGLQRALLLVGLGLRDEARREWNFSLRG
ncbi:MAG: lytic transglycosylase, partial [Burkholderiales bacterium PBB5]